MKKIIKKIKETQTKEGKYSGRLSDSLVLGNHESFRENDSFYRLLVESLVGYAIFTTDKKGNISSWNSGAQELFEYSEDEIIGKNVSIIFRPEDISVAQLQSKLTKATDKNKLIIEQYYVRKDRSPFWASGLIFPLGDETSVGRGFTFIVRDLSEKMEFQKRQESFISTATHELKTPIASMKLYAQIVDEEIKKTKNKKNIKSVGELKKQLDKITALMDYLLDVAKIQKGKLELRKEFFDIGILMKETINLIQLASNEHIILQEGSFGTEIYGDRDRIGQVLNNLITNAIKYSPGADKVIVIGAEDKVNVVISVKDFGMGVSMYEQKAIFERFYRASTAIDRKIDGIGLGLYVSEQIINAHRGKMWVESEEAKGSTFYFSVPKNNSARSK